MDTIEGGAERAHAAPASGDFSLDDVRDVIFRTDGQGHWTYLSASWAEVTGFTREESLGRVFLEFVHPDDRQRNLELFEPLIQRKKSYCLHEIRYLTRDGGFRWIEVHARLTLAPDGTATGTTGSLRDTTERREATERLRQSEALIRGLLEASPDPVFAKDAYSRFLLANRATLEVVGRTEAQVIGKQDTEIYLDPKVGQAVMENDRRIMAHGRSEAIEELISTPRGLRVFLSTKAPLRDSRGEVVGVIGIARDITERKQAEEALLEREERVRSALSAARQVEWEYDVARGTRTVGAGWREFTGLDAELVSTIDAWQVHVHPEDRERAVALTNECLEGRSESYEAEYRLRTAEGGWRWVRSRGKATGRGPDGRPLRVVGTTTDVDEIHVLQERLVASNRLASVGTLAAGVAHEINNPLTWLHANLAEAVEQLGAPGSAPTLDQLAVDRLRSLLQESQQGVVRIAGVVKAMRSLGGPERAAEVQDIDVRLELQSALKMVSNQLSQRARLVVELPDDLTGVRAATSELGRAFLNLLVNAAQAIPEGQAASNVISVRGRRVGQEVVVEIADSGRGISPGIRERIFDPFFTTKPVGHGTGLGLSIVRNILDSAGGRIEVESAEGKGSTFRVWLPTSDSAVHVAAAPSPTHSGCSTRRRVLVVDDEPCIRRTIGRMLRRTHEVELLDSANEALRRIQAGERWDAMLCDMMMPDLDGVGFYEALAVTNPDLLPQLAFMTGGAFGPRAESFLASRDVLVVAKPMEADQLSEAIERLAAAKA